MSPRHGRWKGPGPAALILALGASLVSCAEERPPPAVGGVAAPEPSAVARTFDEGDDGAAAVVRVGERFAVRLKSWAEWRVEAAPGFLRHVETVSGPSEDGSDVGADRWQVLVFEATAPGAGELSLVLGRPWIEDDRLRAYRLKVEASEPPGG